MAHTVNMETGAWGEREVKKGYTCDRLLAGAIGCCFNPEHVADLGCGIGHYTRIFKSFGWKHVDGYEGSQEAVNKRVYDNVCQFDLSRQSILKFQYDLVICLEVGEHIPKDKEQYFLNNVCDVFAYRDLVLSWAIPGQRGRGHFNEQPNEYVIEEVAKRNFKYNRRGTRFLRQHCTKSWFKNTVMVFRKND